MSKKLVNIYAIKNPTRPKTDVDAPTPNYAGLKIAERRFPPIPVKIYKIIIFTTPMPYSIPEPKIS